MRTESIKRSKIYKIELHKSELHKIAHHSAEHTRKTKNTQSKFLPLKTQLVPELNERYQEEKQEMGLNAVPGIHSDLKLLNPDVGLLTE
jgi:hypothetical protein